MTKDIDAMTHDEWVNYREEKLDKHISTGNVLVPSGTCSTCDPHDDYVCFYCEVFQVGESK